MVVADRTDQISKFAFPFGLVLGGFLSLWLHNIYKEYGASCPKQFKKSKTFTVYSISTVVHVDSFTSELKKMMTVGLKKIAYQAASGAVSHKHE